MKVFELIVILGIFVVLPIVVVAIIARARTNDTNKRADIALAAIEKNSDIDIEAFFRKFASKDKTIKEKLLNKLLCGCIFTIFSVAIYIAIAVENYFSGYNSNMFIGLSFVAVPSFGVGVAFLINYFVGKRMLGREMEAELRNLQGEA